jgi:hypothetical protein
MLRSNPQGETARFEALIGLMKKIADEHAVAIRKEKEESAKIWRARILAAEAAVKTPHIEEPQNGWVKAVYDAATRKKKRHAKKVSEDILSESFGGVGGLGSLN